MAGTIRSCAGGVVFYQNEVFLLMSDRGEWVMPKGVIRSGNRSNDVALWRVEDEAGIHAEIIGIAGNTRYDFFSESRGRDISNRIQWFAMRTSERSFHVAYEQGFLNGGFYSIDKARQMLTYDPDKAILDAAYKIYKNKTLVLASGSPRRQMLLSQMGYDFTVCVPDVDETVSGRADDIVRILAERKAKAVADRCESGIIIASDTLVSLDGIPLGKPADEKDAFRMLRTLSGRMHEVFTGICVWDASNGSRDVRVERTGVQFRELSDKDILDYIATGDPMDKAGAYGIQSPSCTFVEGLDGAMDNVMGFPTQAVKEMLAGFGM